MGKGSSVDYKPLLIIGAARSGTKLVRDILAQHPSVDKVPYDINYVWRFGNENSPHDELSPTQVTPNIQRRIHRQFNKFHQGAPVLVEKTVSNCLRVPYVNAIFPNALYIHLLRDGYDVIESVYRQWISPPDWGYIYKKVLTYPIIEAFGYAMGYAGNTLRRLVGAENISTWGPRYQGIDEDLTAKGIIEVCAIQWAKSVERATHDLAEISHERVFRLYYEDFVTSPVKQIQRMSRFCGIEPTKIDIGMDIVSPGNIGKGLRCLDEQQQEIIKPYVNEIANLLNRS